MNSLIKNKNYTLEYYISVELLFKSVQSNYKMAKEILLIKHIVYWYNVFLNNKQA
jgi:hypothetical protein